MGVEGEGEVGEEVVEGDERKRQSRVYIRNANKVSMHVCRFLVQLHNYIDMYNMYLQRRSYCDMCVFIINVFFVCIHLRTCTRTPVFHCT